MEDEQQVKQDEIEELERLLLGMEEDKLDRAIEILHRVC